MDCIEFVESIMGIKLLQYQKRLLKTLEAHKNDVMAISPITGRMYFFPKQEVAKEGSNECAV